MTEFGLLIDGILRKIRQYGETPAHIPQKKVSWHSVVRDEGATAFTGRENGSWVISAALPTLEERRARKLADLARVVLLPEASHYCLSDAGRGPKPRAPTGTKGDQCFRAKDGEGSAGQSWVAGKTEVADGGFDPGFCVVRVRTQGKSDQHQIPGSVDSVQI